MTDDDRLAALFRDAAGEAPPPPFDHDAVVAGSRRIAARRRGAVLGGAMVLLVGAGVGVAVALPSGPGDDMASTAAVPAEAPPADAPPGPAPLALPPEPGDSAAAESAPDGTELPEALRPAPEFTGTPLGPGTTGCAQRQDPALRALVEQVLPEVVGAPEAAVTMECRPGGERGVNLEVDDAGTAGLLTVQYLPPGAPVQQTGGTTATAPTASGGTVVVSSRGPGPGPPPFADRLAGAANYLAPRL